MDKLFRIYRYSEDDPLRTPRGWLGLRLKLDDNERFAFKQQWLPSEEITERDVFERIDAEILTSQWNDYWSSKGWNMRAWTEVVSD